MAACEVPPRVPIGSKLFLGPRVNAKPTPPSHPWPSSHDEGVDSDYASSSGAFFSGYSSATSSNASLNSDSSSQDQLWAKQKSLDNSLLHQQHRQNQPQHFHHQLHHHQQQQQYQYSGGGTQGGLNEWKGEDGNSQSPNHRASRLYGLREQLLRASSTPPSSAEDSGSASAAALATRRRSLSSVPSTAPVSDLLMEQQLASQLQCVEKEWLRSEQQVKGNFNTSAQSAEDEEWFDPATAAPSECINWTEVEELCASMDIAGMRVEEVELFCPVQTSEEIARQEVQPVLFALKFECMTLKHYPGDAKAKELFSTILAA